MYDKTFTFDSMTLPRATEQLIGRETKADDGLDAFYLENSNTIFKFLSDYIKRAAVFCSYPAGPLV